MTSPLPPSCYFCGALSRNFAWTDVGVRIWLCSGCPKTHHAALRVLLTGHQKSANASASSATTYEDGPENIAR